MGTSSSFTMYSSGVFDDPACPTKVSHCVVSLSVSQVSLNGNDFNNFDADASWVWI